jgi:tetratricopeptide (TPR) repeat protein
MMVLAACGKTSADGADGCVLFEGLAKDRIAACTKLIDSGKYTNHQLAKLIVTKAAAYDDDHQYEKAIQEYTAAIALWPEFALAYNGRGSAYDEEGKFDLALDDYNRTTQLDPTFVYGWANRALVEARRSQFSQALADYDRALKIDPQNSWALYGRGIAKSWSGDKSGASEDLTAANKLDPDVHKSYEELGIRPR